jgi:hypothetical protein
VLETALRALASGARGSKAWRDWISIDGGDVIYNLVIADVLPREGVDGVVAP